MENGPKNIILASASKVRRQMLLDAGVVFKAETSNIDEAIIKSTAKKKLCAEIAQELAIEKAQAVSKRHPTAFVIGADQILECDGILFDKPIDLADAACHLKKMRGKTHCLITSACVVCNGQLVWRFTDEVFLSMRNLTDNFIEKYLNLVGEEALLSVGGYQLEKQGAQLFTNIKGDFFTVLGLPLLPLLNFLRTENVLET
jgi:septum formation protein